MRYVAAYLLASLAAKDPTEEDINKILSSVGIESDSVKLQKVLNELKGKNLESIIAEGNYGLK